MTGRHRRPQAAVARRALYASVPALGVVGAVTALTGSDPATVPDAAASGSTVPVATASVPLTQLVPAAGEPALTGVATEASEAADRAGEAQRAEQQRALEAIVDDVRADAKDREAAAAAQGQDRLEEFQRDMERQERERADSGQRAERDDRDTGCDTSGAPIFGDRADPDEIVGRDCGLTDLFGHQRSDDPWIDGQLLSARED